jgi:hypothetical protein
MRPLAGAAGASRGERAAVIIRPPARPRIVENAYLYRLAMDLSPT